jgi:hypothetical protein
MADLRESLLVHRRQVAQVRTYLTWQVSLVAVGCIVFMADLVLIVIEPSKPVARLVLAVAVMVWSITPLVRWRHSTWIKRLSAVAGIVFTADLVMRVTEPTRFAVGGLIVFVIVILTWSVLWFALPLARWRHLTWTKRLAAIGGIAFTTGVLIIVIGPSKPRPVAGFLVLAVAIVIWSVLPLGRWRRWTWTKRLAAVAVIMFVVLAVVAFAIGLFTQAEPVYLEETAGWTTWALLYLALLSYVGASLSRTTAPPATWALIVLGIVFLYNFPPLLAFLSTNGNVNFAHLVLQQFNAGISWLSLSLGFLQYLLLASVPVLLIVLPETLRRRLAGVEKPTTVETLLLSQLTIGAALATGLYAVTLHFAKGPLDKLSVNQLTFATIAVVVLLSPFYKYIVTACWRYGIAAVFSPNNWVAKQQELVKLLRKAFTVPVESATSDGSASHAPRPPGTETDTTTGSPTAHTTSDLSV